MSHALGEPQHCRSSKRGAYSCRAGSVTSLGPRIAFKRNSREDDHHTSAATRNLISPYKITAVRTTESTTPHSSSAQKDRAERAAAGSSLRSVVFVATSRRRGRLSTCAGALAPRARGSQAGIVHRPAPRAVCGRGSVRPRAAWKLSKPFGRSMAFRPAAGALCVHSGINRVNRTEPVDRATFPDRCFAADNGLFSPLL
jgi:hypothetical protein